MGGSSSSSLCVLGTGLALAFWGCLSGCGRSDGDVRARASEEVVAEASNDVQRVSLTADQKRAREMRDVLDGEDEVRALAMARELMKSPEPSVRNETVTVLSWIGREALPELTELLADENANVADAALRGWVQAYAELRTVKDQQSAIARAVGKLKNVHDIRAVLMKTADLDLQDALPLLETIILSSRGAVASTCAKEMFEDLAGEPWVSPARTLKIANKEVN